MVDITGSWFEGLEACEDLLETFKLENDLLVVLSSSSGGFERFSDLRAKLYDKMLAR